MKHTKHVTTSAAAALLLAFAAPAFAEDGWFRAETILLHPPSARVTLVIESSGPPFKEKDKFLSACHEVRFADADFFAGDVVIRCRHLLLDGEADDRIETITLAPLNAPPSTLLLGTGIFDGVTGKCEHDPTYRIGFLFRCEWSR